MTGNVLPAGVTGMFGSRIVHHLLRSDGGHVSLPARDKGSLNVMALEGAGAELVEGDLTDQASLNRAKKGVDVIVSAVEGGPEVIVDGQIALAAAGKRNGVDRIIPSAFARDIFKAMRLPDDPAEM